MQIIKHIAVIFCLILFLILVRVAVTQSYYYSEAVKFQESHMPEKAVRSFSKAIEFYFPLSPLNGKSVDAILKIADGAAEKGDKILEHYCYEMARTSIYLIRSFYTPMKERLDILNEKTANIRTERLLADGYPETFEATKQKIKNIMDADRSPSVFWSFVSVASLLSFISFMFVFIWADRFKNMVFLKNKIQTFAVSILSLLLMFFALWMA